ncbi:hypothetical protein J437_LFUL015865 [Ladona fulva]|uniref:Methyltransferase type 11 domain-containing protein n=1 Tax=Ladona fulva TaxID=123851 RepID=A0A8K0P688_LADFU|nr:hypothetical protein J437_LFUL015865 [Ladona fulva]
MAYKYFETAGHAAIYSRFRPTTPDILVKRIVSYVNEKIPNPLKLAVDIGCGSGQSTEALGPYFENVLGFDPNKTAVDEATKKYHSKNVKYSVGNAEKINCTDNSVQLVTAGQACHWFNLPVFFEDVKRVLVAGGTLALYGYQLPRPKHLKTSKDLSSIVDQLYGETFGEYALQESRECYLGRYTAEKYQIPFASSSILRDESVVVEQKGTIADLVGYISSWSAYQNYVKQHGKEKASKILSEFENELMDAVGEKSKPEETEILVSFHYFLLLGRKNSQ